MKTTKENNILLAEFLEWYQFGSIGLYDTTFHNDKGSLHWLAKDMRFHNDWNWLMEVVDKIESLDNIISFKIASYIEIEYWTNNGIGLISITDVKPKIEAVYNACIEFIKWYNENKEE